MKLSGFMALFAAAFALGCSSTRHIATGAKRSPVPVESVVVLESVPTEAASVGRIVVKSAGTGQRSMDRAVREAKQRAAKIGANAIFLDDTGTSTTYYQWVPITDSHLTFRAFHTK